MCRFYAECDKAGYCTDIDTARPSVGLQELMYMCVFELIASVFFNFRVQLGFFNLCQSVDVSFA
jgi:hypothetical protein